MPGRCSTMPTSFLSFLAAQPPFSPATFFACFLPCTLLFHGGTGNCHGSWSPNLSIWSVERVAQSEWAEAGPALQHKSPGTLLAGPAVHRQIMRGINVIFFHVLNS